MATVIWAFIERLVPRLGTAALMLLFAALSTPAVVGFYAAVMTGYIVLQSLSDGAAKRIAVAAVSTNEGRRFLGRYMIWYPVLGTVLLSGTILAVWAWGASLGDVLSYTPILALPLVMSRTIIPLAKLQLTSQWRRITVISSVSTIVSLAFAVPLLLFFHNALGSIVQLVLMESFFALSLNRIAQNIRVSDAPATSVNYARMYWSTGAFIISLQGQYQLDKLLIGALGGPKSLGSFNLGWSLSRSLSDSLSTSTLSVLQSRVMDGKERGVHEIRSTTLAAQTRALALGLLIVGGVYVAARFVAPLILSDEWMEMLKVVPLMSISAIPAICCYCLLPALMYLKRMRWAILSRILGLIFSFGVGWAVQFSLEAAVWFALFRECVSLAFMIYGSREVASVRLIVYPLVATLSAIGLITVADFALQRWF